MAGLSPQPRPGLDQYPAWHDELWLVACWHRWWYPCLMSEGGCRPPGAAVNKKWMERAGGGALSCCSSSLTLTSLVAAPLLPLGTHFIQSWIPLLPDAARFYVTQRHSCWSFQHRLLEQAHENIDFWNNKGIFMLIQWMLISPEKVVDWTNYNARQDIQLEVAQKCTVVLKISSCHHPLRAWLPYEWLKIHFDIDCQSGWFSVCKDRHGFIVHSGVLAL